MDTAKLPASEKHPSLRRVRLLCVPVPPSSWLGEVVCISRWIFTAAKCQSRGELHWHLRKQAQTSLATPFSACLEVSEMVLWEGLKRDINTESEMSGGSGIPRLVPRFARGERRPTLCDVISDGAVGLEAFVGRKGRGPVDVVARVAAVSPVIHIKNASPFFMVEVESAEQAVQATSSGSGLAADDSPIFKGSRPILSPWHRVINCTVQDCGQCLLGRTPQHSSGYGAVVPPGVAGSSSSDSAIDAQVADAKCGARTEKKVEQEEQLMARLVLNGRRCLAWHPFVVPGRTYVFTSVGMVVLGGGSNRRVYRAFGDAHRRSRGSREGEASKIVALPLDSSGCYPVLAEATQPVASEKRSRDLVSGHLDVHLVICVDSCATGSAVNSNSQASQKLVEVDTGENELAANDTGGTSQPASQPGSTATSPRPSLCRVGSKRKPDNGTGVHQSESRIEHGGGEPTGQTNLGIGDMSHGDEPCRGGIGGRCSCVMTYEGEITGLSSQAGTYILDGGGGKRGLNLYLQHFKCSSLGAGLRRGAIVRIHNVHPILVLGKLDGLGACLRTAIEIVRLSPHGTEASYRPLNGGPNPLPLVVHAWRRAFNAAFLQKETPPDTHMVGQDEPRGMMERNLTVANGTFVTASTVVSAKDMRLTPPADAAHCMAKTREPRRDWGVEVARWVFGDEIGLPKRDVYEEFLNHPPGICGFVDPVSIHCGYCLKKTVEDRSRRDMRDDGKCYGMLAEAEGKGMIHGKGELLQRADEAWHGDPVGPSANKPSSSYCGAPPRSLQPVRCPRGNKPHPDALLRATSRSLSEILEVATANALDIMSAIEMAKAGATGRSSPRGHSLSDRARRPPRTMTDAHSRSKWGMPGAVFGSDLLGHATFTARTPFGVEVGRADGLVGWLNLSSGSTQHTRDGALHNRGEVRAERDCTLRDTRNPDDRNDDTCAKAVAPTTASRAGATSKTKPLLWLSDRTARALVVLTMSKHNRTSTTGKDAGGYGACSGPAKRVMTSSPWIGSVTVIPTEQTNAVLSRRTGNDEYKSVDSRRSSTGVSKVTEQEPYSKGGAVSSSKKRPRPTWPSEDNHWYKFREKPSCLRSIRLDDGREQGPKHQQDTGRLQRASTEPTSTTDGCFLRHGGDGDRSNDGVAEEPGLVYVSKFAVCTEVVLLGEALPSPSSVGSKGFNPRAPRGPPLAYCSNASSSGVDGMDVLPANSAHRSSMSAWSAGLSEVRVTEGGARVLLRHYVMMNEDDMMILRTRRGEVSRSQSPSYTTLIGHGLRCEAERMGQAISHNGVAKSRGRRVGECIREKVCDPVDRSGDHEAKGRHPVRVFSAPVAPSTFNRIGVTPAGLQGQCSAGAERRKHQGRDAESNSLPMTVSEAMITKLTEISSGRGGTMMMGSRLNPLHERELISVVGLLRAVEFRVRNGEGSRPRSIKCINATGAGVSDPERCGVGLTRGDNACISGTVRNERDKLGRSGNAGEEQGRSERLGEDRRVQEHESSHDHHRRGHSGAEFDLFKRLEAERLQLSLTLTQGLDSITLYTSANSESWPAGMIPGYAIVQVEGVSRRLAGNGKNVYLTKARGVDVTVKVLSLGLPPPAIHIPAVGWSASTSPHDWLGKLFCGSRTDPSVTSFHRPTLLFSQLTREASRDSEDGLKGMGAAGMPKGPSKAAHHDLTNNGRGEDNEGGLDALAICGSFQRQSSSDVLGRGVCLAHLNGKTILLDTHSEDTSFSPVRGTATRGVPTDGRSSNPRTSRSSRELCGPSLGVPESSFLRKVPPKHYFSDSDALIGGPTLATLGSLYKRGVLVRAMQRLPWLSVVGFRFIKVATWCNLCGLVGEGNLLRGACWANCEARSAWSVRWEGSVKVDDGTGQAFLLVDGDDVVRLLDVSCSERLDIERVARWHEAVIYSGNVDQPLKPTSWASDTSSAQATSPSAKARLALAASALKVATSRRKITALCLQVIRRWPSSGSVLGRSSKDRESGTQPEYGSAHIDILGEGMETMTLPALMLQAKSVVETSIRAEAYSCLDRLKRPQCE